MGADGSWNITLNSPMGAQQATLVLATDGNVLTGKMESPQGSIDISEGTVDGNNLSWKVAMEQPMPITIESTAVIDGDTITGDAKLGSFGSATFSGTRV